MNCKAFGMYVRKYTYTRYSGVKMREERSFLFCLGGDGE